MRYSHFDRLDETFAVLECYAAQIGSELPTFRGNQPVKGQAAQGDSSWASWPLKMRPIGCPETSVANYQSTVRNIPEEWRSHLYRGGSPKSRRLGNLLTLISGQH
jgi:hypothetical protein